MLRVKSDIGFVCALTFCLESCIGVPSLLARSFVRVSVVVVAAAHTHTHSIQTGERRQLLTEHFPIFCQSFTECRPIVLSVRRANSIYFTNSQKKKKSKRERIKEVFLSKLIERNEPRIHLGNVKHTIISRSTQLLLFIFFLRLVLISALFCCVCVSVFASVAVDGVL